MSSILRALKKLEQDTATGRAAVSEIPVNSEPGRQHKTTLAIIIAVVALVVFGALFFKTNPARVQNQAGKADRFQKQAGPILPAKIADTAAPRTQVPVASDVEAGTQVRPYATPSAPAPVTSVAGNPPPPPIVVKNSAKAEPEPGEIGKSAGLKLQAISWSPLPAKRIAVINNRICHEGEWAAGYLVTKITADAVFLKKGKDFGKLSFALRGLK